MAKLTCDICEGNIVIGSGGVASCQICGIEISKERLKEMIVDERSEIQVNQPEKSVKHDISDRISKNILPAMLFGFLLGALVFWSISRSGTVDCSTLIPDWKSNARESGKKIDVGIDFLMKGDTASARQEFTSAQETIQQGRISTCTVGDDITSIETRQANILKNAHKQTLRAIEALISVTYSMEADDLNDASTYLGYAMLSLNTAKSTSDMLP
jgi:hypothetical protein